MNSNADGDHHNMPQAPVSVDEYLDGLSADVRVIVSRVLDAIRDALPGAEERVRYGMPAVMLDGRYAIHVAGWKRHVGIYPVAPLPEPLEGEIAPYRAAKDALHFRYGDPVPYDLISRLATELRRQRVAAAS
jgi:uncharacterized protein YdhG (YjbR/CyaY superfamily)